MTALMQALGWVILIGFIFFLMVATDGDPDLIDVWIEAAKASAEGRCQ